MPSPVFGRLLTAMITPFNADGSVNLAEAKRLAAFLVDDCGHDGLVINGTTGEAPTTSDAEKADLIAAVKEAVGGRAAVVAGVGTFNTAHTIELAKQAQASGADGLLVVTPYYSNPPQDAIAAHFLTVAEASNLPIAIYDIPHRAGRPVETETLIRVAQHPRIVAVKDAKSNVVASSQVMAACDLAYYSGDDAYTLPLMAVGGVGVIGTSTHFTGLRTKAMIEAFVRGDTAGALALHRELLPVFPGVFATQGVMLVKAGLASRGFAPGSVRAPLLPANAEQTATFVALLDAANL